ncbi:MAG: dephospho-CoA kinase [Bacteroidaceae bacterium]|nr:dephospho-CoA kinase [Bacteroidaceae bacterium]
MSTPIQIGITGGIGSGKSIVSRILAIMQYPVYDTDSQAKMLMDTPTLRKALVERWGNNIIKPNGEINRPSAKKRFNVFLNFFWSIFRYYWQLRSFSARINYRSIYCIFQITFCKLTSKPELRYIVFF